MGVGAVRAFCDIASRLAQGTSAPRPGSARQIRLERHGSSLREEQSRPRFDARWCKVKVRTSRRHFDRQIDAQRFYFVFGKLIVQLGDACATLARDNPARREDGSAIRRKVEPQRHAECEVKPNAGCDGNNGRIHFPVPLRTDVRLPDHAAEGTWGVKMVPLSLENGRLGL